MWDIWEDGDGKWLLYGGRDRRVCAVEKGMVDGRGNVGGWDILMSVEERN